MAVIIAHDHILPIFLNLEIMRFYLDFSHITIYDIINMVQY